jgi:hypothetical protein
MEKYDFWNGFLFRRNPGVKTGGRLNDHFKIFIGQSNRPFGRARLESARSTMRWRAKFRRVGLQKVASDRGMKETMTTTRIAPDEPHSPR